MKTVQTFGKRQFVITADESCMHNYNMSFMAGFLSCVPRDNFPPKIRGFVERKFFSDVPHNNGVAEIAILALRKIESYLNEIGFRDAVVATPQTAASFQSDVFFVSAMDPFGIGPATTTMTGLAGGREPFNKFFFERLVRGIRASNPNAVIIAGGPGAWEFGVFPEKQKELAIDCVFEGAIEGAPKEFFENALKGSVPERYKAQGLRPRPFHTKGAAFWGMTEISRGCGRGCQFCDFELMSGFDWLPKDFIVKEAEINSKSPLVDTITLLSEDTIRYGTPRGQWKPTGDIVDLVKELKKLGKPLSFTHCCLATALANPKVMEDFSYHVGLDEKHLSGFQTGIESGSPRIMQRYMTGKLKPWSPQDWPEVVQQGMAIMIDNYVIPHATLVLGLEGETPEDTIKTIELVEDLKDYPSLILPLFFVPLSILKDRFFLADMMTTEQKELLMVSTRHTAKWAMRLPNWSGSLGFFDRIVFMTGAEYVFEFLEALKNGQKGKGKIARMVTSSFFKSAYRIAKHSEPRLGYYDTAKIKYPVLDKIKEGQSPLPIING